MTFNGKLLAICLTGVLMSLLLVGIVSSTLLRHVVQVLPLVLVLAALSRHQPLTPFLVLPIFVIWALLMLLIWLYLLGIVTFFNGSFSPIEIALTISIGAFSAVGIVACLRSTSSSPLSSRIAGFATFAVIQIVAMWISFMPAFANR